jgi:hypothetical protein
VLYGGSSTVALQADAAFRPRWRRGEWKSRGQTVDQRPEHKDELRAAILACVGRAIRRADSAAGPHDP